MAPLVPADDVILKVVTPHGAVEQVSDEAPEQVAPPFAGVGLVQVRDWVPVSPQAETEHVPKALHPPSTGVGDTTAGATYPPPPPPEYVTTGVTVVVVCVFTIIPMEPVSMFPYISNSFADVFAPTAP